MFFAFARSRLLYRRTATVFLMLSFTVMIAFFTVLPLLNGLLAEAYTRAEIDSALIRNTQIRLSSQSAFNAMTDDLIRTHLGDTLAHIDTYRITREILCGQPAENCYKIATYPDIEQYFTLVEGRFPTEITESVEENLAADIVAEALIARPHAEREGFVVGDVITVGREPYDVPLRIAGIVEPKEPQSAFWDGQEVVTVGVWTEVGMTLRYDFALIVNQTDYEAHVQPVVITGEGTLYEVRIDIDRSVIHAANLDRVQTDLLRFEREYRELNPDAEISNAILNLVQQIVQALSAALSPVYVLGALILLVLALQSGYLAWLCLTRFPLEWEILYAQGARNRQVIFIYICYVTMLALIALPVGVVGALLIFGLFTRLSTIAPVIQDTIATFSPPPMDMLIYALVSMLAGVGISVLVMVIWLRIHYSRHNDSIHDEKSVNIRPYIALGLTLSGLALMLRLYLLSGSGITERLQVLFTNPMLLFRPPLAYADRVRDNLNMLGAPLLMGGIALLLMPLISRVINVFQPMTGIIKGGVFPLAIWRSARDRQTYILAFMIMGTVVVGTMAVILYSTFADGLYSVAQSATGGDARLVLADGIRTLPDVSGIDGIMQTTPVVMAPLTGSTPRVHIVGVNLSDQISEVLAPLANAEQPSFTGIVLPEDTQRLQLRLFSEFTDDAVETRTGVILTLRDAIGVPLTVVLTTSDPTVSNRFVDYSAELPEPVRAPWRLIEMRPTASVVDGTAESDREYVIYIDNFVAISEGGEQTVIADWEAASQPAWQQELAGPLNVGASQRRRVNLTAVRVTGVRDDAETTSIASFRITYRTQSGQAIIPLLLNAQRATPVPVLISPATVTYLERNRTGNQPIAEGSRDTVDLRFGNDNTARLDYEVLEIIDGMPAFTADDLFIVMDATQLLQLINARGNLSRFTNFNQVWLTLDRQQPTEAIREDLSSLGGIESVDFAWNTYRRLLDAPLPNAAFSVLYIGFWLVFGLNLLIVNIERVWSLDRESTQSDLLTRLGFSHRQLYSLLVLERGLHMVVALMIGTCIGLGMAFLWIPFFEALQASPMRVPSGQLILLLGGIFAMSIIVLWLALIVSLRKRGKERNAAYE